MRMLSFPPAELLHAHVSGLDVEYKKEEEEEEEEEKNFELDRASAKQNVSIFFLSFFLY
jgi:hypothetical protein